MACGTPVIATRVGGLPTFLQDGQNGLIVAPRAPDELTEAIIQLIANTALRNRLGHASRQTVEERFSWQVIGENFIQGYQTIQTGAIS
jgi:glycosyltransferase involved in cell wall biosynthesis